MNINIAEYFKLDELDQEDRVALVGSITNLVLARLSDMIGDHLTEQELQELEELSAKNDGDAVLNWLNDHIPSFSKGVDEVLAEIALDLNDKVNAVISAIPLDEES